MKTTYTWSRRKKEPKKRERADAWTVICRKTVHTSFRATCL